MVRGYGSGPWLRFRSVVTVSGGSGDGPLLRFHSVVWFGSVTGSSPFVSSGPLVGSTQLAEFRFADRGSDPSQVPLPCSVLPVIPWLRWKLRVPVTPLSCRFGVLLRVFLLHLHRRSPTLC